jgi:23S rRNA (guanosine2251-2'-O)-methyltransferase
MNSKEEGGYIYGRRAVQEILNSSPHRVNKIFLAAGDHGQIIEEIRHLARKNHIIIGIVPRQALSRYVPRGAAHQGVVASVAPIEYAEPERIIEPFRNGRPSLILILDEITDPQNFGAILRTCDAVGVAGVLIPRRKSVGLTPVVAKHSAGATNYVPVARIGNLAQFIDRLQEQGWQVVGAAGGADRTIYDADFRPPTALVIGSEGTGIRRLIRQKCDFLVSIPMQGHIGSLNASVAAAVILYEALRQRKGINQCGS